MRQFDLTGKAAVVTGGNRGIGAAIARALAAAGADVAVVYRSREAEAEMIRREIEASGRKCRLFRQDLADTAALPGLMDRIAAECGRIDILVNNAGMASLEPFDRTTPESFEKTMRVNLAAPFFLAQQAALRMIRQGGGGRIVNISSTNGLVAEAHLAAYNASKGGLELLTKSLAIELAPHGITVNSVAPGLIETEIGGDFPLEREFKAHACEHIPLGRYGTPAEVAGAVVYLTSEAGRYVTGQHIVIDGGLLADQFPRMKFFRE
ncbi:MAG TPA: glucose 1-dehydrogenase [Candidatus Brocadiia bacterium]|nr:glucose 1-dehydrogenase [Candidatus Brocadiia bacterium]